MNPHIRSAFLGALTDLGGEEGLIVHSVRREKDGARFFGSVMVWQVADMVSWTISGKVRIAHPRDEDIPLVRHVDSVFEKLELEFYDRSTAPYELDSWIETGMREAVRGRIERSIDEIIDEAASVLRKSIEDNT